MSRKRYLKATPEQVKDKFFELSTIDDIPDLLEEKDEKLIYKLIDTPDKFRYKSFFIKKKSGDYRKITNPIPELKLVQRKLNDVFTDVYKPSASVHGFAELKSIRTNADAHQGLKFVLNLDLMDFFPTLSFRRIRGLLNDEKSFNLPLVVAMTLANLCCCNNSLPQGAPTSPILSNMICYSLDNDLVSFAKYRNCNYTRYADDLTFSTNSNYLIDRIAQHNKHNQPVLVKPFGEQIKYSINKNGFYINFKKIRLYSRHERQVVTGLTVNFKTNVSKNFRNQIRAMLNAWNTYGHDEAEREFHERYDTRHRNPFLKPPSFRNVVRGKIEFIGMVRGRDDPHYLNYLKDIVSLDEKCRVKLFKEIYNARIFTEGKTDGKHLQAALSGLNRIGKFRHLSHLQFDDSGGDSRLTTMYKNLAKVKQAKICIFIFDRDVQSVIKDLDISKDQSFKSLGNNIFAALLPAPNHRSEADEICIELLYHDEDLMRKDEHGRRIYLSNEFLQSDSEIHKHKEEDVFTYEANVIKKTIEGGKPQFMKRVIEKDSLENLVLTKDDFAESILTEDKHFIGIDFSGFEGVFKIIEEIIESKLSESH